MRLYRSADHPSHSARHNNGTTVTKMRPLIATARRTADPVIRALRGVPFCQGFKRICGRFSHGLNPVVHAPTITIRTTRTIRSSNPASSQTGRSRIRIGQPFAYFGHNALSRRVTPSIISRSPAPRPSVTLSSSQLPTLLPSRFPVCLARKWNLASTSRMVIAHVTKIGDSGAATKVLFPLIEPFSTASNRGSHDI